VLGAGYDDTEVELPAPSTQAVPMDGVRRQSMPLKNRLAIYEADDPTMLNRLFIVGFVFPPLWWVGTGYCVSSVESSKTMMRQAGMRNAVMSLLSLLLLLTLFTGQKSVATAPHGERMYWDFTHPVSERSPTGWENFGPKEQYLWWRPQSVTYGGGTFWCLAPEPFENRERSNIAKYGNVTAIIYRSPSSIRDAGTTFRATFGPGGRSKGTVEGREIGNGFLGIALRCGGRYVAAISRPTDGIDTLEVQSTFRLNETSVCNLEVIDRGAGPWGWFTVKSIEII
jgi:hypothetical protein